jgi:hypothetical protein
MISSGSSLRHALAVALFTVAGSNFAQGAASTQGAAPARPPVLEPLPEISPPPELASDPDLEPQITIKQKEGETIEEARVNGHLIWIKVTPRHGKSYYLIPDAGGVRYVRRDNLDYGLKVPMWLLFEF